MPAPNKEEMLNQLLNELHGMYSLCYQSYDGNSDDDILQYEINHKEGMRLLMLIQQQYSDWINTSAPSKELQQKYEYYMDAAEDCLQTTCAPPHPASQTKANPSALFQNNTINPNRINPDSPNSTRRN